FAHGELGHLDLELAAAAVLCEIREAGAVRGDDRDAGERRELHSRNTTSTVTSSHATTHSVHATTLDVMPRVTASASGFGAPPFATTSLAMPHAYIHTRNPARTA